MDSFHPILLIDELHNVLLLHHLIIGRPSLTLTEPQLHTPRGDPGAAAAQGRDADLSSAQVALAVTGVRVYKGRATQPRGVVSTEDS